MTALAVRRRAHPALERLGSVLTEDDPARLRAAQVSADVLEVCRDGILDPGNVLEL